MAAITPTALLAAARDLSPTTNLDEGVVAGGLRRKRRANFYYTASPCSRLPVFGAPVGPKWDVVPVVAARLLDLAELVFQLSAADGDAGDRDYRIAELVANLRTACIENDAQEEAGVILFDMHEIAEKLGGLQRGGLIISTGEFGLRVVVHRNTTLSVGVAAPMVAELGDANSPPASSSAGPCALMRAAFTPQGRGDILKFARAL